MYYLLKVPLRIPNYAIQEAKHFLGMSSGESLIYLSKKLPAGERYEKDNAFNFKLFSL